MTPRTIVRLSILLLVATPALVSAQATEVREADVSERLEWMRLDRAWPFGESEKSAVVAARSSAIISPPSHIRKGTSSYKTRCASGGQLCYRRLPLRSHSDSMAKSPSPNSWRH